MQRGRQVQQLVAGVEKVCAVCGGREGGGVGAPELAVLALAEVEAVVLVVDEVGVAVVNNQNSGSERKF